MAISYFGYPTYAAYQAALLRTAHTAQLRAEFSISEEDHCAKIAKKWLNPPGAIAKRAADVVEFLKRELRRREVLKIRRAPVNGKAFGGSPGWWWEHPVIQPHIPPDLLEWVQENCHPERPCFYSEEDGLPTVHF